MAEQQPIDRQQNRMSLRETLGSRFQSLRGLRSRERKSSQDGPASKDRPASNAGPTVLSPRSREGALLVPSERSELAKLHLSFSAVCCCFTSCLCPCMDRQLFPGQP